MTGVRGSEDGSSDRLVAALLNELDGVVSLRNVFILAATNRPDMIDSALLRPGRIDNQVYIQPPTADERQAIFRIQQRKMSWSPDVDLQRLADLVCCPIYVG